MLCLLMRDMFTPRRGAILRTAQVSSIRLLVIQERANYISTKCNVHIYISTNNASVTTKYENNSISVLSRASHNNLRCFVSVFAFETATLIFWMFV
jgi:hypothetical protein